MGATIQALLFTNGGEGGINGAFHLRRLVAALIPGRPLTPPDEFASFEFDIKSNSHSAHLKDLVVVLFESPSIRAILKRG